jgi:salicylate hydroxylase
MRQAAIVGDRVDGRKRAASVFIETALSCDHRRRGKLMVGNGISVAIVGGGIGGLCAALSLLRAGVDAHVYEQADALAEVGAGIQISPNASRILHRAGLGEALANTGVAATALHQRRWQDGRTLLCAPLAEVMAAAFGAPHFQIHRADLLKVLAEALPAANLHLGHRLTTLADHGSHVEAAFENGRRIAVDALVGADGIHSAVRRLVFGPEHPHFTGCACYRGLVPAARLAHLELPTTAQVWMGPGKHFVHYFVRGRQLVNFVAVVEQEAWTGESWTDRGKTADALRAFDGWHPQVREILGAVSEPFIWALFDRKPMPRWSVGRVTLLGDACHAMLPFMAQGSVQAIEDGAALSACLRNIEGRHIPEALRRYERLRLPRTSRVQSLSEENKRRFHLPDGPAQVERDAEMARGTTDWSVDAVAWLYGHDAEILDDARTVT